MEIRRFEKAIRCYIDGDHYFDLALKDAPEQMTWYEAKLWCEEHYCRLLMKHEMKFIVDNLDAVNEAIVNAGGEELRGYHWSSSEYDHSWAWLCGFGYGYDFDATNKQTSYYIRPVLSF